MTLLLITLALLFPPEIKIMTIIQQNTLQKSIREDGGTPLVVTQT